MRKLRVGILFGGRSGEHEVSLMSALSVVNAIDREKFDITLIGITKEGRWVVAEDPVRALASGTVEEGVPVLLSHDPSRSQEVQLIPVEPAGYLSRQLSQPLDVVFPVLHGPYGEDGTVQGLLDLAGIPYVGAGVMASAVGMDKEFMKIAFAHRGLPIVRYAVFPRSRWDREPEAVMEEVESSFDYPVFVKPANLGSSVGISKVRNREELRAGLQEAAAYDRKVLVEEGLEDIHEVECSVLGNEEPEASEVGEIVPCNEFYDYRAKYIDDRSELIIPARLPEGVRNEVKELALEAFRAIDCAGMARVDFFVTRGDHEIYVNEINTIPGFTRISMYPKLWEASGLSYSDLITRLIELALERHRDRLRSRISYTPRDS